MGGVLGIMTWHKTKSAGSFTIPVLAGTAAAGQELFNAECAKCHGTNAVGGMGGPPLIHIYYEPGHHSDAAFVSAIKQGVRQHHWDFGDMPAQAQIADADIPLIIEFVRETQRANGIQ